jgi:DNA polymerase-3 subunit alpha
MYTPGTNAQRVQELASSSVYDSQVKQAVEPERIDPPFLASRAVSELASPPEPQETPARNRPVPPAADPSPASISMPFFVMPGAVSSPANPAGAAAGENEPRMLTVILRSGTDREKDIRRLKRVHGLIRSFPGSDRFSLMVFEKGHRYVLEFPNDTTGICSELIRELIKQAGEGNVHVETIHIQ